MENIDNGIFYFCDSVFFENGFPEVNGNYFDENNYFDLFSRTVTSNPYTINITIIYNYGLSQFDSIKSFPIYAEPPVPFITSGDVNGDGFTDLLFAHNIDQLLGIIYNDGTGSFSSPEYYNLSFPPIDIACADLNDDARADIVISGSDTEIFFSTETGFQQQVLTTTLSHDVLISDFDNDFDNDIITHTTFVYPNHRVFFFENLGNNEFFEHDYFQFTPFCSYAQIADFNNDSLPDMIFIESFGDGLQLFYNKGDFQLEDQQFIPVMFPSLKGLACGDLDNNGFQDIAITHSQGSQEMYVKLLFNDGKGNFVEDPVSILEKNETKKRVLSCYPNPFSDYINIEVSVKEKNSIDLSVYDINGKKIKTITNKIYSPGKYKLMWNGKCKNGKEVPAGIFFVCLSENKKVMKNIKVIKK